MMTCGLGLLKVMPVARTFCKAVITWEAHGWKASIEPVGIHVQCFRLLC